MTIPFTYRFLGLSYPYDFLKFNFSHFTPQVGLFFVEKGKPKLFGFKNVMAHQKNSHVRYTLSYI